MREPVAVPPKQEGNACPGSLLLAFRRPSACCRPQSGQARVFDIHDVIFFFCTHKAANVGCKNFTFELARDEDGGSDNDEFLQLEIRDDDEDGDFLVANIPPPSS
jgi:hypothetical protein